MFFFYFLLDRRSEEINKILCKIPVSYMKDVVLGLQPVLDQRTSKGNRGVSVSRQLRRVDLGSVFRSNTGGWDGLTEEFCPERWV